MESKITHGEEGTRIVVTLTPDEARDVHVHMFPNLYTSMAYDKLDAILDDGLRQTIGRNYRKAR
jgi:hypothetical protein